MSNRFDKAVDISVAERLAEDETVFEHIICKYMMHKLKLSSYKRQLRAASRDLGYGEELRLDAFYELFPSFPIRLGTSRLRTVPIPDVDLLTASDYHVHNCPRSIEPARFKNFNGVPFVRAFYELRARYEDFGKPVGLVFPRRGFRYGLIIHNDQTEAYWETGSAWVYKGTKANPTRLYIQPFQDVLDGICHDGQWRLS